MIGSLIFGVIIGGLSRIEKIKPIMWIFGLVTIATLISYLFYVQDFLNNPSIDGIYTFISTSVHFAIASAFSAAGENIGRSFGGGR